MKLNRVVCSLVLLVAVLSVPASAYCPKQSHILCPLPGGYSYWYTSWCAPELECSGPVYCWFDIYIPTGDYPPYTQICTRGCSCWGGMILQFSKPHIGQKIPF